MHTCCKSSDLPSMFVGFECSIIGAMLLVKGKLISVFSKIQSDIGNILFIESIEKLTNDKTLPFLTNNDTSVMGSSFGSVCYLCL